MFDGIVGSEAKDKIHYIQYHYHCEIADGFFSMFDGIVGSEAKDKIRYIQYHYHCEIVDGFFSRWY